jgi:hypothetical protein
MNNKPIYYLSHPYSLIKDKDLMMFHLSQMRETLESKGLTVFSPLCHTHDYSKLIKKKSHEYWIKQDLSLIQGIMNHDGWIPTKSVTDTHIYYDSGIIMLISKTAFTRELVPHPKAHEGFFAEEWMFNWKSEGCRIEYEFAQKNHIQIFELESFLEEREVVLN